MNRCRGRSNIMRQIESFLPFFAISQIAMNQKGINGNELVLPGTEALAKSRPCRYMGAQRFGCFVCFVSQGVGASRGPVKDRPALRTEWNWNNETHQASPSGCTLPQRSASTRSLPRPRKAGPPFGEPLGNGEARRQEGRCRREGAVPGQSRESPHPSTFRSCRRARQRHCILAILEGKGGHVPGPGSRRV